MAIVTANTALNMSIGLNIGYWTAREIIAVNRVPPAQDYIRGTSTDQMDRGYYFGSFVVVSGVAQSGTVTGYEAQHKSAGYVTQFELTGLNYSLNQFFSLRNSMDRNELTEYLLRGSDTIKGSSSSDKLYAWAGNDTVNGYSGNDSLSGGSGNDKLNGGAGSDRLYGGTGKDILTGSTGADIFDFNSASEAGTSSSTRDTITDFLRGSDRIDLSGIDANSKTSGNNSFTKLLTTGSFTAPGQLKFVGGVLYGNIDSDSASEFSITLTGINKLALSDFIL